MQDDATDGDKDKLAAVDPWASVLCCEYGVQRMNKGVIYLPETCLNPMS